MAASVAEWLAKAEEKLSEAVSETVQEMAEHSARLLTANIPSNRGKTKAAVRHKMTGTASAKIGLYFADTYNSRNTFTHRLFRNLWRDKVRPQTKDRFIRTLNNKLQK